jgi:uncharacterized protein (UPF0264 family)
VQRLLVSIRGKNEALEATAGGAHVVDVEYPATALGTPYPLNIKAVREAVHPSIEVSTNIGEQQLQRGTACQAAVGVAVAGADIVKAGLAGLEPEEAIYLGRSIARSIRAFNLRTQTILAFFADPNLAKEFVDPVRDSPDIAAESRADGLLVDTFDKSVGKGLLDYLSLDQISSFVSRCHKAKLEAWVAGSITESQMRPLWKVGVDVICVRKAACDPAGEHGRFGQVRKERVGRLARTLGR